MHESGDRSAKSSCYAGSPTDLVMMSASTLSRAIRRSVVSCCEVTEAYLDHIDRLNPIVNAIILRSDRDGLMAQARQRDECLRRGEYVGWMHGFPIAISGPFDTEDVRTTSGSPPYKDVVPTAEDRILGRLARSGGIIIGRVNSSECGPSGNIDIGITLNAHDQAKTAGGGGGGAAVALALRMLPVAKATDHACAQRIPAAFNSVFGFRLSATRLADDGADIYVYM